MKLSIKVITNAKQEQIKEVSPDNLKIYLTCAPEKGKANKALIKLLAKYYGVAKSRVKITAGEKVHNKIVEIDIG